MKRGNPLGLPACEDIAILVSAMQDRKLTLAERLRVRFHLLMCEACTRFERQLRVLKDAVRRRLDE